LFADNVVPIHSNAAIIYRGITEEDAQGEQLDKIGARLGKPRHAAAGAVGFVSVSTAVGGAEVQQGRVLRHPQSKVRYEAAETKHVEDGDLIRIRGQDTGPGTDQIVGTVLQWDSPPPGVADFATVADQGGGLGLVGGANVEDDDAYSQRLQEARANPSNYGNDAFIHDLIETGSGIRVQKAFTYPAPFGGGSTAFTFTTEPQGLGGIRVPTAAQLQEVEAHVVGHLPADDQVYCLEIEAESLDLVLKVRWAGGASGWANAVQWPPYLATGAAPGPLIIDSATGALAFILETEDGTYSGVTAPVPGNVIGLWDATYRTWRRKTIATVTGTGPWTLTCTTASGASDTSYVPVVGQRVSPWSASLDQLTEPVLTYLEGMGPGQMVASLPDDGRRLARVPESPKQWPSSISSRILTDVLSVPVIANAVVQEGNGAEASVGELGVKVKMLQMADLSVFPL
jgi:hypothetical protein